MLLRQKKNQKAKSWSVVLVSALRTPAKETLVKELTAIFPLSSSDAEDLLTSAPIVLIDELDLSVATEIKKRLESTVAEVMITQDSSVLRKCSRTVWPNRPDLSVFQRELETAPAIAEESQPTETAAADEVADDLVPIDDQSMVGQPRMESVDSDEMGELAERIAQLESQNQELSKGERIHAEKIAALENTNLQLEESLKEQLRKNQELRVKGAVTEEQLRLQDDQIQRFMQELDILRAEKQQQSAVHGEMNEEKRRQAEEKARFEQQLAEKEREAIKIAGQRDELIRQLEEERRLHSGEVSRLSEHSREYLSLQENLHSLHQENTLLREAKRAAEDKSLDLQEVQQKLGAEIENLQQALEERNHLIIQLEAKARDLAGQVGDQERGHREAEETIRALEKQAEDLESRNTQLLDQIRTAENVHDDVCRSQDAVREELLKSNEVVRELEKRAGDLSIENAQLIDKVRAVENSHEQICESRKTAESELLKSRECIRGMEAQSEELRTRNAELLDRIRAAEQSLDDARQLRDAMQLELSNYKGPGRAKRVAYPPYR
jgi:chromosome segregation ATPase